MVVAGRQVTVPESVCIARVKKDGIEVIILITTVLD